MIKEDLVSSETAKLLKEKGFDEPCCMVYMETQDGYQLENSAEQTNTCLAETYRLCGAQNYSAPTLQTAVNWLRTTYKLHIAVSLTYDSPRLYEAKIMRTDVCEDIVLCPEKNFNSPEEAYGAAIKYCLEHLI